MSRSIVAVEMLKLNKNNIMEFKEVPAITEVTLVIRIMNCFTLTLVSFSKVHFCSMHELEYLFSYVMYSFLNASVNNDMCQ